MTVYELIQALTYYPADLEIIAEVGNSGLQFDIGGVEDEFPGRKPSKDNRPVIVLDP